MQLVWTLLGSLSWLSGGMLGALLVVISLDENEYAKEYARQQRDFQERL